jgi:hypothetical protein
MGLKGYRLWVMGQLDSTCRAPVRATLPGGHERVRDAFLDGNLWSAGVGPLYTCNSSDPAL